MRINLKLKPYIYTGKTKKEVLSKFTAYGYTLSSIGSYKTDLTSKNIVAYNLIKEKAKYKQYKYKSGKKKGMYKESKLIKSAKWTAYVYKINKDFAKSIGLQICQKERNFEYLIK